MFLDQVHQTIIIDQGNFLIVPTPRSLYQHSFYDLFR